MPMVEPLGGRHVWLASIFGPFSRLCECLMATITTSCSLHSESLLALSCYNFWNFSNRTCANHTNYFFFTGIAGPAGDLGKKFQFCLLMVLVTCFSDIVSFKANVSSVASYGRGVQV